ncbi:hypothetical protein LJB83_01655 [Clostridia bacterium OttesenSCG-928-F22]|nr:hypothetical protein [Clostridia bacterium OttesenSCG-928-F22]
MGISEILTVIIAVFGWFIGYFSSSKINLKNAKREIIINYLIEAYEILSAECNTPATTDNIEKAISNIQLFGTPQQIALAKRFSLDFVENGTAQLDDLLFELRNHLRDELNIPAIDERLIFLRIMSK